MYKCIYNDATWNNLDMSSLMFKVKLVLQKKIRNTQKKEEERTENPIENDNII